MKKDSSFYMQKAIALAAKHQTPFAALIFNQEGDYVEAVNTTSSDGPLAHAEINAINKLSELSFSNPAELTLVSTVEPCPMCMGAIIWAEIGSVCYGCSINDVVKFTKQIHIYSEKMSKRAWYEPQVISGVMKKESLDLFKKDA